MALLPAATSAQSGFPLYGKDKFLGNANDFTTAYFPRYFNQLIPENAGKWGSAAGTTRTAAMRWTQLDQAYNFAKTNNVQFNFHILLWGNQQPTWMVNLPPDEQLLEIKKWFAAVAARYPNIDVLQVVNEGTWDPPDGSTPKNAGANLSSSGNYVQALGGYNGTDGTGYDWILNGFRLAKQYFPNTKLMLNDVAITGMTAATDEYLKIINLLKRENLIDVIGLQAHAFEFIPGVTNAPTIPGHPYVPEDDMRVHKANLDRLAATGIPIEITELDLDGLPVGGVPGDEMQLRYYRNVVPTFWEHPAVRGHHAVGMAGAQPLAQRAERPDRPLQRHAQARGSLAVQLRQRDRAGDPARPELHAAATATRTASGPSRPTTGRRRWVARTCGRSTGRSPAARAPGSSASSPARASCASPTRSCSTRTRPTRSRCASAMASTTSAETDVTVVTEELANVVDGRRRRHRARDALA